MLKKLDDNTEKLFPEEIQIVRKFYFEKLEKIQKV